YQDLYHPRHAGSVRRQSREAQASFRGALRRIVMWLRLRQIALVAHQLEPVLSDFHDVLGLEVCFRDPGVKEFGLHNALMPVGNQFIEVVSPIQENTAGGRYLDRRKGDGGYMTIMQCDTHPPRRKRVDQMGIRLVADSDTKTYTLMQLHPRD